jgi:antitoxin ParD1/3/4
MPQRQTMNVSLPKTQEQFVRSQVDSGRYRTASEVVRDGLRLLEENEHRRLVEKWIYEDLSDEEMALLPAELKDRVREHFRKLVDDGLRSAEEGGWLDGPETLAGIRARVTARHRKRS